MHNPESIPEYETHKLLLDFEIRTDHCISARRPDLVIVNRKRTCRIVVFAVAADHRIKLKESKKRDKYLDLARELKKRWNIKMKVIPMVICRLGTVRKGIDTGTGRLGYKRTNGDYLNLSIVEIGQKAKRSPGDLKWLAVTRTPEENHQLTLV